jgi:DnaJ-class molecular chaperone
MSFFSSFMGGRGGHGGGTPILMQILGVDKKATHAEIKKVYIELAKKHHPDKGGSSEKVRDCLMKFNEIKQAY